MLHRIATATAAFGLLALGACAAPEPTFGDRLAALGGETSSLAQRWNDAQEKIAEGRDLVGEGEDDLDEGEDLVASGRSKVRNGERMIDEGLREQRAVEQAYRQGQTSGL